MSESRYDKQKKQPYVDDRIEENNKIRVVIKGLLLRMLHKSIVILCNIEPFLPKIVYVFI